MRILNKKTPFIIHLTILALAASLFGFNTTSALSGSEFQAGRIIDDGVFYNGSSMTAAEIQNFLNAKVPNCDTWGQQMYSSTQTRAQYGQSKGYPAPYTCLKDYRQDTGYKAGQSGLCSAIEAKTNRSAAQIIDDVARACHISQKVILVMLQKEQGLVTDDWPWSIQYRSAMGYGCPDTAPCDAEYYGFFNQVYNAALQFQRYKADPTYWNHVPFMSNNILYQANTPSCGSRSVYIENYATAGLYNYTPYTPNHAALNNLYGTGDACSAYGNRNFWRYFRDWFGSVYSSPFFAHYGSQTYLPALKPGTEATVSISFANGGSGVWFDDTSYPSAPGSPYRYPVRLATNNPLNRESRFSAAWPSANRAATLFSAVYESNGTTLAANQHTATPGQIGRFTFNISVPKGTPPGTYREHFKLVADGTPDGAFNDLGAYFDVVVQPEPSLQWVSQTYHPSIDASDSSTFELALRNNGNVNLYDDVTVPSGTLPVHLATSCPINKSSPFSSDWPTNNRPGLTFSQVTDSEGRLTSSQHIARPGDTIRYRFKVSVPEGYAAGTYRECFQPILEGSSDGHFSNLGIYSDVTVTANPVVKILSSPGRIDITAREPLMRQIQIKNTGNLPLKAGSMLKTNNGGEFRHDSWVDENSLSTLPTNLNPGDSATLPLDLLAPYVTEKTNSTLSLFIEDANNGNKVSGSNLAKDTSIWTEAYVAGYHSQSPYPSLTKDQTDNTFIRYKNLGNKPWYDDLGIGSATSKDPLPLHLATTQPINRHSGFASGWPTANRPAVLFTEVLEADGTTLATNQHMALPGQIVTFRFDQRPAAWVKSGTYREYFQPILEGTPTGNFNFVGTYIDVTVK